MRLLFFLDAPFVSLPLVLKALPFDVFLQPLFVDEVAFVLLVLLL